MKEELDHENGPFGRYQRASIGHVLNALCAYGIPLHIVEDVHTKKIQNDDTIQIWHKRELLGRYKYFEGIDRPLFNFENRSYMSQPIMAAEGGEKKAMFRLNLSRNGLPGFTISGPDASPKLHRFLSEVVLTNRMTEKTYLISKEAGAFFQGGSEKPNGEFIFIEFWIPKGAQAFMDYLNTNYVPS